MKIVGLACGAHDTAYCVFEDGKTLIHEEYERFSRVKEEQGDVLKFLFERQEDLDDVKYYSHFFMRWQGGLSNMYPESFSQLQKKLSNNDAEYMEISHHKAHAANAFFSSNFEEALILSLDGGGEECDMVGNKTHETCAATYKGKGNKIQKINDMIPLDIGGAWSLITKEVFGLSNGPPIGNQCGTVMAMGAVAKDPQKFVDQMRNYMESKSRGDFEFFRSLSEEDKFNLAGSLQIVTEEKVISLLSSCERFENLCIVGGVALNGLMNARILNKFDHIKNIYIPPIPYDAGLAIGCCQYIYYHMLNNTRIISDQNETPYLGVEYSEDQVLESIKQNKKISYINASDDDVLELLKNQKIISIFNGRSESGRRALGNRSIFADPRSPDMKDMINEKVKHRQWFRPFAPVILRDDVKDWFVNDVDSPYMNIISLFKEDKKSKVPAVVHHDGTGRFQSVKESDNFWLYNFLTKWKEKSGVPILLNTSFNDREPIVETPENAINCFLKTEIDYLYFPEHEIIVEKCQSDA